MKKQFANYFSCETSLSSFNGQRIHGSDELVWVRSLIFSVRCIHNTAHRKNGIFKLKIAVRFAEFCALHKSRQIGEVLYA